jgi:hypothetical protein
LFRLVFSACTESGLLFRKRKQEQKIKDQALEVNKEIIFVPVPAVIKKKGISVDKLLSLI